MAHFFKKPVWALIWGGIAAIAVLLAFRGVAAVNAQAGAPKTLTRNLEPVVIKGSQVAQLLGAPADDLFVYTFAGNNLAGQIPVQVDKITAAGAYTVTQPALLAANDEIVFMAGDLGDRPAGTLLLTQTLTISPTWYEITVTDPLDPAKQGWAYLVRSSHLTQTNPTDYADFDTLNRRINTANYSLGFASTYPGLNHLTLGGSPNLLDRTKLRVIFTLFGVSVSLTEIDLDDPQTNLIKDGPVRVIVQQKVAATPGGIISQAGLNTTNLAYAALVQSTAQITFSLPALVQISAVRSSADFNSDAAGATFYNANTAGGVAVDGVVDSVAATPFSYWSQLSHAAGRLVQVYDPTAAGGVPANFYCDDNNWSATPNCDTPLQTGDSASYGDSGVLIEGSLNSPARLTTWLFALPPAAGPAGNVGQVYGRYYFNRLVVAPTAQAGVSIIYLPLIFKGSP